MERALYGFVSTHWLFSMRLITTNGLAFAAVISAAAQVTFTDNFDAPHNYLITLPDDHHQGGMVVRRSLAGTTGRWRVGGVL